ncbi:energy-coupling factor ABC transporter permease [Fontimonas sp. SYSU GA230001]|uniref:energy-coupling factor ABC transporter permease n=1 Tax=Fontimonas sp. SYSU GA230001 TaxID=3142450 RepID=UPI0032B42369
MTLDLISPPPFLFFLLTALHVVAVLVSLRQAPWHALRASPQRLHLVFGALVALLILWSIGGKVGAHVSLHLLGMTSVTLLLGPALAILAGTAALAVFGLLGRVEPAILLASGAVTVALPVVVTVAILHLALRHAPRNLFVFMLGVGFLGGALSMLAVEFALLMILAIAGELRALDEWLSPLMVLAMFPEGFVNGAVTSALAVYKPHWLRAFDDRHFLG